MAIGVELTEREEILFRHIHPDFLDGHQPSSQAFAVMPKDKNRLSLDRSSLTTAKESFEKFIANGYKTVAVFGLAVGEFNSLGVNCYSDPFEENVAHAVADFSNRSRSASKSLAKRLRNIAIRRGKLYP